jgi:hypothetical protein
MPHRLAPCAERDLDDIWLYVAQESNSIEIADRYWSEEWWLDGAPGYHARLCGHDSTKQRMLCLFLRILRRWKESLCVERHGM